MAGFYSSLCFSGMWFVDENASCAQMRCSRFVRMSPTSYILHVLWENFQTLGLQKIWDGGSIFLCYISNPDI